MYGVIDSKGTIVVPPNYEYVSYTYDGMFRIEQGNKMGYLNLDGKWVWALQE